MVARWIFHVDVDAFFASVEQALNPALKGKPLIVGGDGEQRTVVASCSYEAREQGVRTGMRTEEAKGLCPEALFVKGDARIYGQAAEAVFRRLDDLSPRVQPVSLDEAFVDVEKGSRHPLLLAEELCKRVRKELDLPLSVGIGSSLLVAKLATGFAKPRGCFYVQPGNERFFLQELPVEKLPGVGRKTRELLRRFNISTVEDLLVLPRELLVETFGKRGAQLFAFARAEDDRRVEARSRPRSVSRETSFEEAVFARGVLFGMGSYLLERAMKEVLRLGCRAKTLSVRLRYVDGVFFERSRTLKVAAGHEANLIPVLDALLRELYTRRVGVHLLGITLSKLVVVDCTQPSLFEADEENQKERLARAVALIRERHGFGAVVRGPAVELLGYLPRDRDGFRLRIPSLTR